MAKKNFYAVRVGRIPGIYKTWDECKAQVDKFTGADYKGVATYEEAEAYIKGEDKPVEKEEIKSSSTPAKTKKKFYAIKYGVDPKTKQPVENVILETWAETELFVKGVGGAVYSGFPTREEAEAYISTKDPLMKKSEGLYPKDCLHCYVDGSFNGEIPNYGFGLVYVKDNKVLGYNKGAGNNTEAIEMQQIGGELLGAINALLYAKKNNYKEVVIFHDYLGVCYHATGYWKRDNKFSEDYFAWMQKFFENNKDIKVQFCKVDAHTGDDFNELADGFAKMSVGLTPDNIFYKFVDKYQIKID